MIYLLQSLNHHNSLYSRTCTIPIEDISSGVWNRFFAPRLSNSWNWSRNTCGIHLIYMRYSLDIIEVVMLCEKCQSRRRRENFEKSLLFLWKYPFRIGQIRTPGCLLCTLSCFSSSHPLTLQLFQSPPADPVSPYPVAPQSSLPQIQSPPDPVSPGPPSLPLDPVSPFFHDLTPSPPAGGDGVDWSNFFTGN